MLTVSNEQKTELFSKVDSNYEKRKRQKAADYGCHNFIKTPEILLGEASILRTRGGRDKRTSRDKTLFSATVYQHCSVTVYQH